MRFLLAALRHHRQLELGASGSLGWPGRTEGQTVIWPHEARVTPEILMLPILCMPDKRTYQAYRGAKLLTAPVNGVAIIARPGRPEPGLPVRPARPRPCTGGRIV